MSGEPGWSYGETTTILNVFHKALERDGHDWPFIDYSGVVTTLGELEDRSTKLAHGLLALGAKPGECVTSVLDNSIEQILLMLACSKIGAISVPLNTAYKGEFLRHQVEESGAAILFADPDYAQRVLDIESELVAPQHLLVRGGAKGLSSTRLKLGSFEDAYVDGDGKFDHVCKPGDVAMLIFTAGTTGLSKGCMVSQNYTVNMARQISTCQLYEPGDVIWTPLPGFHFNQYTATVVAALMIGGKAAIYPKFSTSNFWPEIERTGATVVQILATMLSFIADAPENEAMKRCFGQIRIASGAPFPPALQDKWRTRFGAKECGSIGFGQTEAALVTSVMMNDPAIATAPGSSGKRNDDFDVRIVDDDDREQPAGVAGEILVRPKRPHVMFEGYWRRPEATMKVMKNLWFHTGDVGKFDENGFFYFVDRKKDYLRRRGENISSLEMEHVFRTHKSVLDVAVHAVFADHEDDVKVTLIVDKATGITEQELCRWSADNLPYFAVPRFIEFRDELPRNPVGRVLKYQLRDEGITPGTWDLDKSDLKLAKR